MLPTGLGRGATFPPFVRRLCLACICVPSHPTTQGDSGRRVRRHCALRGPVRRVQVDGRRYQYQIESSARYAQHKGCIEPGFVCLFGWFVFFWNLMRFKCKHREEKKEKQKDGAHCSPESGRCKSPERIKEHSVAWNDQWLKFVWLYRGFFSNPPVGGARILKNSYLNDNEKFFKNARRVMMKQTT